MEAVSVGSVLTLVGALAFAPLVLPGALLGAGAALTAFNELVKTKADMEVSNMYFLWKLSKKDQHANEAC